MNGSPTRYRRSVVLLACVLLAAALACKGKKGPSPATVARAAELKPKVTQVLAHVASLSAKVKSGAPAGSAAPAQKFTWGTVAVTGENYLQDPTYSSTDVLALGDPMLTVCKYLVASAQIQKGAGRAGCALSGGAAAARGGPAGAVIAASG